MQDHEGDIDEDFFSNVRKIRKAAKDDILDETFKKAELSKGIGYKSEKKIEKKPFLKLGVVLIAIAVIALVVINFMPWIFIKYDASYGSIQESYSLQNFKNEDKIFYSEINYIFESQCTNCSNNSKNFIGLTKNDFIEIPQTASYVLYALIALGVAFTIIEMFRKIRNFHGNVVVLVHSIFAVAACVMGVFIMSLFIKFLGAYFLLFYNMPFIEASGVSNLVLIFPAALVLVITSFATILVTVSVMKINFNEFEKKLTSKKTQSALSNFRFGSGK